MEWAQNELVNGIVRDNLKFTEKESFHFKEFFTLEHDKNILWCHIDALLKERFCSISLNLAPCNCLDENTVKQRWKKISRFCRVLVVSKDLLLFFHNIDAVSIYTLRGYSLGVKIFTITCRQATSTILWWSADIYKSQTNINTRQNNVKIDRR